MTQDRQLERSLYLQDIATLLASLLVAHGLRRVMGPVVPWLKPEVATPQYVHLLFIFVPTWALVADRLKLAKITTVAGPAIDQVRAVLWTQAWGAAAIGIILLGAQLSLNRSLIAAFLVVSTVMLIALKRAQGRWVRRQHRDAVALVVGPEPGAIIGEFEAFRGLRVERLEETSVAALSARLRAGGVDEVVLPGSTPADALVPLIASCEEAGVPSLVRAASLDVRLVQPQAEVIGPSVYFAYRPQKDRPALLLKALADRVLAAIGLVLVAPLLLGIAIAIAIAVGRPVFFVQTRGGRHGHPFPMLKFRTMRLGAEAERDGLASLNEMDGPVFKIAHDPRLTKLGAFLRRWSLDELPQLINVLLGQMSLVGPRPLPLGETRELGGADRRRLSMKPGITCLWQVSGRNELGFRDWMLLDLKYVDNWSLGLDVAILLRTLPAVLGRRGAS